MALQPWRTGKIIRIVDETPNTKRYWIQLSELDVFDFKPGQFVQLEFPIHEQQNKRLRSYSISSWPDGTNIFELLIVLNEAGAGTMWLFNHATVGTEFPVRGAMGVFTLPDPIEKDLFFICTGTGIAPFRSMAQYIKRNNLPHNNIFLLFGTRKKTDLLYYEELTLLQNELPGFHFIPTLSREDPMANRWEGRTGYVHPIYEELCSGRQDASFYLCGWKAMIDETKKRILEMGYDKKAIHQELYG